MAQQTINRGTVAGDGTGETLFSAFGKVNDNFTELYNLGVTSAKVSNWDTAYSWGNHASAGYALSSSLGGAATLNVGTSAGTVAAGNHNHSGTYEPADATILKSAAIGSTVQGYDVDTAKLDVAQSWTAKQTFKATADTVYTITDGAAFEIDPANGNIQVVTLGASRSPAATNFGAGQVVLLGVDDGTAYTITWPSVTWVKSGGTASAPTLATTGYTWVLLWKVSSTLYGSIVGSP